MATLRRGAICSQWPSSSNDIARTGRIRTLSMPRRPAGLSVINGSFPGMIVPPALSSPTIARNYNSRKTRWMRNLIGPFYTTILHPSSSPTNDSYGNPVRRFPRLLSTTVPSPHQRTLLFIALVLTPPTTHHYWNGVDANPTTRLPLTIPRYTLPFHLSRPSTSRLIITSHQTLLLRTPVP